MSFRIEDKIPLAKYDKFLLHGNLINKGMVKLYPDRFIHSIYFDNNHFEMYKDSIEGSLPRKKVRIRNYDKTQKYNFEIKISSVEGRYKKTLPLSHNQYINKLTTGYLDFHYGLVKPIIKISYKRMYYQYKSLRITFDSEIKFFKYTDLSSYFASDKNVMEIKSPDLNQKSIIDILIPFEKKRYSKYTEAVEYLNMINCL